ncbi:MAG: hypothetical protein ACQEP7_03980 [bacterium]
MSDKEQKPDSSESDKESSYILDKISKNINPEDIEQILQALELKINEIHQEQEGEQILTTLKRARLLGLMLQAWWEDRFTLPWRTAGAVGGALLYFLNPRGLIKNKLSRGWILSDAVVISLCFHLVNEDLKQFIKQSDLDPKKFDFANLPAEDIQQSSPLANGDSE